VRANRLTTAALERAQLGSCGNLVELLLNHNRLTSLDCLAPPSATSAALHRLQVAHVCANRLRVINDGSLVALVRLCACAWLNRVDIKCAIRRR
jgi:hypothetical protein